ncbi:MAG: T9SS type A sorting domain-containing protein, partial [Bacteroidota bacterium]
NIREYIEGVLVDSLVGGHTYCVQFYVSLADRCIYATDKIGAYFSHDSIINYSTHQNLPVVPQVENIAGNIISDTLNWVSIIGNFTAQGGEKYITIGNFRTDSLTLNDTIPWGVYYFAYYYIDDVSVTDCTVGIDEINENTIVNIYPNPVYNELNIKMDNIELSEIILYDLTSRKLLQQKFTNSVTLNTEQLAKGIYIYEVRNKNGVIKKGKVVKE